MARYDQNELRELHQEIFKSKDKGIRGLVTLLMSIWKIEDVDWRAASKELFNLRSGKKLVLEMESLPYFEEVMAGKYHDVVKELGGPTSDDSREFYRAWEKLEGRLLRPIEGEWTDYLMSQRARTASTEPEPASTLGLIEAMGEGDDKAMKKMVAKELLAVVKNLMAVRDDG